VRRVWRYQRGNQNLYIEEEQTTHWPKEKKIKDKQRSTKHKIKDRVTRAPLKKRGWTQVLRKGSRSFSSSGTRRVNLVNVIMVVFTPTYDICGCKSNSRARRLAQLTLLYSLPNCVPWFPPQLKLLLVFI